jgi:hypothetical protein
MTDSDGHFGEKLAAHYDDSSAGMFAADAIDQAVELLAGLAGLRRRDRWADWNRAPFTAGSEKHISVWEKPV